MLTHKPVNRYLASKDAESAGATAPDGASPRRLRTPPPLSDVNDPPLLQAIRWRHWAMCCIDLQQHYRKIPVWLYFLLEKVQPYWYSLITKVLSQLECSAWQLLLIWCSHEIQLPGIAFPVEIWYYLQCCDSFQQEGGVPVGECHRLYHLLSGQRS